MFDLVDASIRKGPNSIVFGKIFQLESFKSGFCNDLEDYRPYELGSIIFRSKRSELRKKLGETYKRENFLILEKKTFLLITLELLDRSS